MSKPQLRVVKNESKHIAEIFLYGIIGDFWYNDDPLTARAFQQQLSMLSDYSEIHVHINSPGGDCMEGLAISNAIKSSKKTIHTYNDGICASMAAVILCSAKDGNRHAAKGSLTMFHSASTISWGNAEQMRQEAETLDKYDDVLAEIIGDALGKTLAETKAMYFDGKDHWLTATEMAAEGLVVIDDYKTEEMPENATAMKFNKVAAFYNPQIKNENMFGKDKFKNLSALAKKEVADITPELVQAVNDEIETEAIAGVTLVMDSQLEAVTAEAGKVPALEASVLAEKATVTDLQNQIVALNVKLGRPAVDAAAPVVVATDPTPAPVAVVDNFETSYDREMKELYN